MNDVFINALVERIKVDEMTIEQVPILSRCSASEAIGLSCST